MLVYNGKKCSTFRIFNCSETRFSRFALVYAAHHRGSQSTTANTAVSLPVYVATSAAAVVIRHRLM
jgi:hypothetical protein